MITKDEITMYICSYALFLKEMLMFRYIITIHPAMNSFGTLFHDKIFSLTFPWLLTTSLPFPWHVSNSLTFPGFPDKWSPGVLEKHTREMYDELDEACWNHNQSGHCHIGIPHSCNINTQCFHKQHWRSVHAKQGRIQKKLRRGSQVGIKGTYNISVFV